MSRSPSGTTRLQRLTMPDAQRVRVALERHHQIYADSVDADSLVRALTRGGGTATCYNRSSGASVFAHLIVRPSDNAHGVRLYHTTNSWNAPHVPNAGLRAFTRGEVEQAADGGAAYVFWGDPGSQNAYEFTASATKDCFNLMVHTALVELNLPVLLARS